MNLRRKILHLTPLILILFVLPSNSLLSINSYNVPIELLVIVDDGYGGNVPPILNTFRHFGWNVTIAGVKENVTSCSYLGYTVMDTDILIPSISDVSVYDAVTVLPGESHVNLLANQTALDLIKSAAEANVVVSGWCKAVRVLAYADVIDGKNVTGDASFVAEYEAAGATYVGESLPVIDGNIVTSVRSNYYQIQTCYAIGKAIGIFESNEPVLNSITVLPDSTEPKRITLSFDISDESILQSVKLSIYEVNRTTRERLSVFSSYYRVVLDQDPGIFTFEIVMKAGLYEVDLEINDAFYNQLTLINCTTVDVEDDSTTDETSLNSFLISLISIIGIIVLMKRKNYWKV